MPKERGSLLGMLLGMEPGPFERIKHDLLGKGEGEWGEESIATMLRNHINGAYVFQNVYVPIPGEDKTAELDILMICPFGIFVFESKAFGGKIYGYQNARQWTQYLNGKKSEFYNPIKQNENHCIHLASALRIPREKIMSMIVFENRADLSKVEQPDNNYSLVCSRSQVYPLLRKIKQHVGEIYFQQDINCFSRQVEAWTMADDETKQKHVENAQQAKANMEQRIAKEKSGANSDVCPLCGRKLVLRTGPHSTFWGCTGYPKCKYTRHS